MVNVENGVVGGGGLQAKLSHCNCFPQEGAKWSTGTVLYKFSSFGLRGLGLYWPTNHFFEQPKVKKKKVLSYFNTSIIQMNFSSSVMNNFFLCLTSREIIFMVVLFVAKSRDIFPILCGDNSHVYTHSTYLSACNSALRKKNMKMT